MTTQREQPEQPEQPPQRRRDVRVDRIGYVQELVKHWIEADTHGDKSQGLKGRVKAAMSGAEILEGDAFEAVLAQSTDSTLSTAGLLRLYEGKAITRPEFLQMVRGVVEPARKILPAKSFARLVLQAKGTPRPDRAPQGRRRGLAATGRRRRGRRPEPGRGRVNKAAEGPGSTTPTPSLPRPLPILLTASRSVRDDPNKREQAVNVEQKHCFPQSIAFHKALLSPQPAGQPGVAWRATDGPVRS